MLARASTDAGVRLRRSKSASTVHRHPPPILPSLDPDAAKQQALAAATAAFARAQAQDAANPRTRGSPEVSRSKSNASRKSNKMQGQGSHFPARGSSFRSSQEHALKRERQADIEKYPPSEPASSIGRTTSTARPLSTQPSIAFSDMSRPSTQPKPGRSGASMSATSQQIRKARSMYYASSVQTGSPMARPPTMYLTTPPTSGATPTLEVPNVLPSSRRVGPSPLSEPRMPVLVAENESVDKARDSYLQSFQQRSVKHKPSLFLAPFIKRQDRGKEKSKHVGSGFAFVPAANEHTPADSTADVSLDDSMPQVDKKDKRSFSGSLKSKFKRVFRRSSKQSSSLPVQQIQASREYFGSESVDVDDPSDLYAIPSPDDDMLQRVRARTPSLEPRRSSLVRPGSRTSSNGSARSHLSARSNRSLHSEAHATNPSASRVTSWGTTATMDTLTHRALKRMTVIHESKDSIGSEADRAAFLVTNRKSLPSAGLAAFREPMPMESLLEESSTPVDPKRVFSALMKEIRTSTSPERVSHQTSRTPGAESDVFESSKTKILHVGVVQSDTAKDLCASISTDRHPPSRCPPSAAVQSTQSKTSSIRSLGRAIRSTIRTVTPVEQRSSPCPERPVSVCGTVRIPSNDVQESVVATTPNNDEDCVDVDARSVQSMFKVHAYTDAYRPNQYTATPKPFSPSPTQIEKRVERARDRWKTPLDDVEQVQFPRETDRTYNVANFRHQTITDHHHHRKSLEHIELLRTDVPVPFGAPVSPPTHRVMSPLSPSIYSRNTDGASILPNDSATSLDMPNELGRHHDGGSAVILTSQSVRSYVVGTPSPRRTNSTRSSRDWKAWLSHEVSSMEFTSQEDLTISEQYLTPSKKHQIDGGHTSQVEEDDATVILRPSSDTAQAGPKQETLPAVENSLEVPRKASSSQESEQDTITKAECVVTEAQTSTDTIKEELRSNTPASTEQLQPHRLSRPGSSSLLSAYRPASRPTSSLSMTQRLIDTPLSARMNDRFPFINTGRRSSSNSARSSRLSRSPPESVSSSLKSSKAAPSPRIYSDLSVPTLQTSQGAPNVAMQNHGDGSSTKENVTPPSIGSSKASQRPHILPLGSMSRPKSLQPLSSTALNRGTGNAGQYMSNIPGLKHSKHSSTSGASPTRPRIQATIRITSPEQLNRRPKSAFDLRATHTALTRPASELRRPALNLKASTDSFAMTKEPSPGAEQRFIDSVLEEGERSGSNTPGQRMADHFLRERKSTGVLLGGMQRGSRTLVREDTPAFL